MLRLLPLCLALLSACSCQQAPNELVRGQYDDLRHADVAYDAENSSLDEIPADLISHWLSTGKTVLILYGFYDENFEPLDVSKDLAQRHVTEVRDMLIAKGIEPDRIKTPGLSTTDNNYWHVQILEYPKDRLGN